MTIEEVHKEIDQIIDKDAGAYFPPAVKDAALDRASMWLFNKYRKEYATNIDAYEAMAPFKKKVDYTTNGSGVININTPAGDQLYVQLLSMDVSVVDADTGQPRRWPVEILKDDEIASRRNSQLLPPSATEPIAEETARGAFILYPAQVHAGTARYFKRPAVPVFGYNQVGRVITYDPGTSTQLEWTEPYLSKVIWLSVYYLGVNLDSEMLRKAGLETVGLDV